MTEHIETVQMDPDEQAAIECLNFAFRNTQVTGDFDFPDLVSCFRSHRKKALADAMQCVHEASKACELDEFGEGWHAATEKILGDMHKLV